MGKIKEDRKYGMCRAEFEALYISQFPVLVAQLARRGIQDGADVCQTVYVIAIDNGSYKAVSRGKAMGRAWLRGKVWNQVKEERRNQYHHLSLREE